VVPLDHDPQPFLLVFRGWATSTTADREEDGGRSKRLFGGPKGASLS
jgi:hypothetical protein